MATGKAASDIQAYIARFPRPVRDRLEKVRAAVRRAAPHAQERLAYGIPTFYLDGNLVHFAAFASHLGFYPTPSVIAAFRKSLAKYKSAKASVQFPHSQPLPLALVAEMVRFRVAEMAHKKRSRRKS